MDEVSGPLILGGKTSTGIKVPEEVANALGKSREPPVKVTLNGHTWRSSVAFMGGEFWLGVSAENREAAGVKAGDELEVYLEPDTAPRQLEVPADLAEALAGEPEARSYFEGLFHSNKRRHVLAIEGAGGRDPAARYRQIGGHA